MQPGSVTRIKRFAWTYLRPLFLGVRHIRKARRQARDARLSVEVKRIQNAFVERYGLVVQDGPFRGMRYLPESHGSPIMPKLIGCYEAEVHQFLNEYCAQDRPVRIVDIGCDEGYYAVGMALRIPSATVYGFDSNPAAVEMCRSLARLNGVESRVVVEGECTAERLNQILRPGDLLICDCEGCEFQVVDPGRAPSLRSTNLLVEMHDSTNLDLNITATLISRFKATHEIQLHSVARRQAQDWNAIQFLPLADRELVIDEGRDLGQQWAVMRVK